MERSIYVCSKELNFSVPENGKLVKTSKVVTTKFVLLCNRLLSNTIFEAYSEQCTQSKNLWLSSKGDSEI